MTQKLQNDILYLA